MAKINGKFQVSDSENRVNDLLDQTNNLTKPNVKDCNMINPFVHTLELDNPFDKLKTAILTVFLLPFRVICICLLLITAWLLACIGLYGLTMEDLQLRPITGWRKTVQKMTAITMQAIFWIGSFHYIRKIGQLANSKDAPILVVAPHSSFFDSIVVVHVGPPAVLAKAETATLPFFGIGRWSYLAGGMAITVRGRQATRTEAPILVLAPHSTFLDSVIVYVTNMSTVIVRKESMDNYAGKLINYTQPIYVWRDDPNSRQNTIKNIIERANSKDDWPQIIVFPEGTCTNRSCLITFKPGAFYPGVPIQPVCIRYPNKLDTVTWTWQGPGVLKLLWLTLTQIHSHCEIEFLPVYVPTAEEKLNPKLYAKNVRNVMAKALGVPLSDYTYSDCKLMTRAKDMNIPYAADIVEVDMLRRKIGLDITNVEATIVDSSLVNYSNWLIGLSEFSTRLKISSNEKTVEQLFSLFMKVLFCMINYIWDHRPLLQDKNGSNKIDFRDYLLCALFLIKNDQSTSEFVRTVSKMYHNNSKQLTQDALHLTTRYTLAMCKEESDTIFKQIDQKRTDSITIDEFLSYLQTKPEYSFVFKARSIDTQSKSK